MGIKSTKRRSRSRLRSTKRSRRRSTKKRGGQSTRKKFNQFDLIAKMGKRYLAQRIANQFSLGSDFVSGLTKLLDDLEKASSKITLKNVVILSVIAVIGFLAYSFFPSVKNFADKTIQKQVSEAIGTDPPGAPPGAPPLALPAPPGAPAAQPGGPLNRALSVDVDSELGTIYSTTSPPPELEVTPGAGNVPDTGLLGGVKNAIDSIIKPIEKQEYQKIDESEVKFPKDLSKIRSLDKDHQPTGGEYVAAMQP